MRLTGRHGERRGHRDDICPCPAKRRVDGGKADIVTDRKPQHRAWKLDRHRLLAARIDRRLAPAFARGEIDLEQVDLVIARRDAAIGRDHERTVAPFVTVAVASDRERAQLPPKFGL